MRSVKYESTFLQVRSNDLKSFFFSFVFKKTIVFHFFERSKVVCPLFVFFLMTPSLKKILLVQKHDAHLHADVTYICTYNVTLHAVLSHLLSSNLFLSVQSHLSINYVLLYEELVHEIFSDINNSFY